jgi:hypothetical protein
MLKPALIALTMMGCDCEERHCVPLDAPVQQYLTIGECEAALATAIDSETHRLFPLLKAQCDRQRDADDLLAASTSAGHAGPQHRTRGMDVTGRGFTFAGRTSEYLVYRTSDGVVAVRDGFDWALDLVQGSAARAFAILAR